MKTQALIAALLSTALGMAMASATYAGSEWHFTKIIKMGRATAVSARHLSVFAPSR